MANELIPLEGVTQGKFSQDENFAVVSTAVSWLPRITLCGGNSDLAKEGKIPLGNYAIIYTKEQYEDLTKQFDCIPLAWRPRAMDINDLEAILSVFDPNDPEFKRIAEKSAEQNSKCMYGPEFLVWVPSLNRFATFYCNSKTARRVAPEIKALFGRPMTLKGQLIKNKSHSWHGPVVTICSTPISNLPSREDVLKEVDKFNNPPANAVESAPEEERAR